MTWTTEFPTKHGFYWLRNWITKDKPDFKRETVIARIVGGYFNAPYDFCLTGNDGLWGPDELISAEWYGPIEPPTDEKQYPGGPFVWKTM